MKLRLHHQQFIVKQINPKLSAKYYGPFQIEARVREVAYRLHLPPTTKIHLVFHVSQLKKAVGNHFVELELPLKLALDHFDSSEPIAILTSRERNIDGGSITEWLIQWKNKPMEEATWETIVDIKIQFTHFCLEDKVGFSRGSIDGNLNSQLN